MIQNKKVDQLEAEKKDDIFPIWESPYNVSSPFQHVTVSNRGCVSGGGCDTRYGETLGEFASSLGLLAHLGVSKTWWRWTDGWELNGFHVKDIPKCC